MADIYQITTPNGSTYNLKDKWARDEIANIENAISGGVVFMGQTTTELTDGSTTTTIVINGNNVTAVKGYLVVYGNKEFIFDGTKWIELGDLDALGNLAWVDTASGTYTPVGTVSQPTFTGDQMTSTATLALKSYTLSSSNSQNAQGTYIQVGNGTISSEIFQGTAATITSTVTPAGTVAISTGSGTANYTPAGTVSAPVITKNTAGSTTTVNSITDVGTLPTLTTSVANENLTISFSQGTLPTKGANTTVKTGDATYEAEAPTFTGTAVDLEATFTGTQVEGTASYTPAGNVSVSLGKKYLYLTNSDYTKTISATGTPTGTISQPTFSGTQATITVAPST